MTAGSAAMTLTERARDARNRLIGSRRFRDLAQKIPVLQYFAEKSSRDLFSLATGFVHSQVLLACVRGRLIEALAGGPRRLDELARRLDLPAARLERLLEAGASLKLLERRDDARYALGPLGAALNDNPGLLALIEHHEQLYRDLAEPLALVGGDAGAQELRRLWPYAGHAAPGDLDAAGVGDYTALMAASQRMLATQILDSYSLKGHRHLLDVGGGDGTFLSEVAARWPDLALTLVDLPAVSEIAAMRLRQRGLERVAVAGLDAFSEPLPAGADLITLVRILHDHDDARVATLLAAAHRALPPGGRLLIAEPMSDAPRAGALIDTYFNVYLLAMGSGRPRRSDEYRDMLAAAGFGRVRACRTRLPLLGSVLVAER